MRKITINGVEIEVDEACEVSVDGNRVTIADAHKALPDEVMCGECNFESTSLSVLWAHYWSAHSEAAVKAARTQRGVVRNTARP